MMSREAIARALKRLRENSGLTADQVGALIGKSGKTVNAWENNHGQPDADTLLLLCDIYHVPNILDEFRESPAPKCFQISEHEKRLITVYRNKPDMQKSVNTLLGLEPTIRPLPSPDTQLGIAAKGEAPELYSTTDLAQARSLDTSDYDEN